MLSSKTKQFLSPGSLIVHASTSTTRSKATGSTSTPLSLSHAHTTLSDKKNGLTHSVNFFGLVCIQVLS